jgi:hypothetical protein
MKKNRHRHKQSKRVYPHNDLANTARRMRLNVEAKDSGDRTGIAHDVLAGYTFLAFSLEARINFLGAKLVKNWRERDGFDRKLNRVLRATGVEADCESRPFSVIAKVKEVRDLLAHGKPIESSVDETLDLTDDEAKDLAERGAELLTGWEEYTDPAGFYEAYDDVEEVWNALLQASGIPAFDTLSSGLWSISLE